MAITFGVATAAGTTTGFGRGGDGTFTCTLPTSWAVGQLAILLVYLDQGTASITTPASGWTEISGSPWGSGTPKLRAFYHFLITGDVDPVVTVSGSSGTLASGAAIATFNLVDTTTPIEVVGTASNGTGTPMTAAEISTLTDGAWVLGLCGRGDNEAASAQTFGGSATGVTERLDAGSSGGDDSQVSIYTKEITSYGATGGGSATTSATDPWVSVIIALKPSSATVPTLTTSAASSVAEETATGNGNITATGGGTCFARGFVYDTASHGDPGNVAPASSGYATGYTTEAGWFETGAFTGTLTSLAPAVLYYYRSWAQNSAGYAYGGEQSFTTIDWAIRLSASANIAASAATSTTYQLTAPSGKVKSDFDAGKISDDTNPIPSIDITADNYTELEWCVKATAIAQTSDVYEFRVTNAGTVLDTYTVTPQWTIGGGALQINVSDCIPLSEIFGR
jgi:hypothetical protein